MIIASWTLILIIRVQAAPTSAVVSGYRTRAECYSALSQAAQDLGVPIAKEAGGLIGTCVGAEDKPINVNVQVAK